MHSPGLVNIVTALPPFGCRIHTIWRPSFSQALYFELPMLPMSHRQHRQHRQFNMGQWSNRICKILQSCKKIRQDQCRSRTRSTDPRFCSQQKQMILFEQKQITAYYRTSIFYEVLFDIIQGNILCEIRILQNIILKQTKLALKLHFKCNFKTTKFFQQSLH